MEKVKVDMKILGIDGIGGKMAVSLGEEVMRGGVSIENASEMTARIQIINVMSEGRKS